MQAGRRCRSLQGMTGRRLDILERGHSGCGSQAPWWMRACTNSNHTSHYESATMVQLIAFFRYWLLRCRLSRKSLMSYCASFPCYLHARHFPLAKITVASVASERQRPVCTAPSYCLLLGTTEGHRKDRDAGWRG